MNVQGRPGHQETTSNLAQMNFWPMMDPMKMINDINAGIQKQIAGKLIKFFLF